MPVLDWLRRRFGSPPREAQVEARSRPVGEGAAAAAAGSVVEGERALRDGRHANAIAQFESALEREPSAAVRLLLAQAREAGGDEEGAIDELELALHHHPDDAELRVALAELLLRAGRRVEAGELCERGLERAADLPLRLRYSNCLMRLGRLPEAIEQYEIAVDTRPGDAGILSTLGLAQANSGDFAAAEASYARALRRDPTCVEGLHNLAMLRREQGAIDAARELFERALALRPESVETESALAHTLRDLGRFDEALALYRKVLGRPPQPVDALLNYSYALLMNGQLAEGWDAYERRLTFPEPPVEVPPRTEWWSGEAGAAVHVVGEQGLGDQLMFASCLPDLLRTASQVSLSCAPRLEPLFRRSFGTIEMRSPQAGPPRGARWAPMGSLPRYFRRQASDFPAAGGYLRADPGKVARWRERLAGLGPGPRIGLSWRGGALRTRGHLRSIPVAALAALGRVSPAAWISLQYGRAEEELAQLGQTLRLHHWPEIGSDLDECAALIEALDVVVAIDTTASHLAGALGKRVWILLDQAPEWRYGLAGATLPWYPSARLFRQSAPGDWAAVLDSVCDALARELA